MSPDTDFYKNVYGGDEYPDLELLLKKAAEFINAKISVLPESEFEIRQYELAVCAQAEYIGSLGGRKSWQSIYGSSEVSSVTIGSFSMSRGSEVQSGQSIPTGASTTAFGYLEQGGLLYRGCVVWG